MYSPAYREGKAKGKELLRVSNKTRHDESMSMINCGTHTQERIMNQSSKVTFFTIPMREMSLRVTKTVETTSNAVVMARTTGPLS